jgi:uncharacterized protein
VNTIATSSDDASSPGDAGRRRLMSAWGEPLFLARWDRAFFMHYEVDAELLQRQVPFALDLHDGRAFGSIVAFSIQRLRPHAGGLLGEWLFKPIATHGFLNVRTYVKHRGEPGIFFIAEWLSNPLSVRLGPASFGLPYHYGRLEYEHRHEVGELRGRAAANEGRFDYRATLEAPVGFRPCAAGSLTEFLLERYSAFTSHGTKRRFFRVWHGPWLQAAADVSVASGDLIGAAGEWWKSARFIGANYSPGADVWMGRPHRIRNPIYENETAQHSSIHRTGDALAR